MIINLSLRELSPYRVEIRKQDLAEFLDVNNFDKFISYLSFRNIEHTYYPQLQTYHFFGLPVDTIISAIGDFKVFQVIYGINSVEY